MFASAHWNYGWSYVPLTFVKNWFITCLVQTVHKQHSTIMVHTCVPGSALVTPSCIQNLSFSKFAIFFLLEIFNFSIRITVIPSCMKIGKCAHIIFFLVILGYIPIRSIADITLYRCRSVLITSSSIVLESKKATVMLSQKARCSPIQNLSNRDINQLIRLIIS